MRNLYNNNSGESSDNRKPVSENDNNSSENGYSAEYFSSLDYSSMGPRTRRFYEEKMREQGLDPESIINNTNKASENRKPEEAGSSVPETVSSSSGEKLKENVDDSEETPSFDVLPVPASPEKQTSPVISKTEKAESVKPARTRKPKPHKEKKEKKTKNGKIEVDELGEKLEYDLLPDEVDDRPLWEKNPEMYRKKKPFIVRFLGAIWSFIVFCVLTAGVFGVIALAAGFTVIYAFSDSELDTTLANFELDSTSQLLATDSTGSYVVYEELFSTQNRTWAYLSDMPSYLYNAAIAKEDHRFYQHMGFDIITTVRAGINYVIKYVTGGSTAGVAGGSTLTQQMIKNVTGDDDVSGTAGLERKFKEILRAFYIERKYTKEQILEYYCNVVYFGNGCYGVSAAADYYFGKTVNELTVNEAAAIIAITKSPKYYDPYRNDGENNRGRRLEVLWELYDQEYIDYATYNISRNEELKLKDQSSVNKVTSNKIYSYFTDTVFEWLIAELGEQKGYSRTAAINYIYTSGLRIYTTVDPDIQHYLEDYFENQENYFPTKDDYNAYLKALASAEETGEKYDVQQVAFELLDPTTGNILGIIGGRGKKEESLGFNRVTMSRRQPGSSIKPLSVYGQAIENNLITSATVIDDSPLYINVKKDNKTSLTFKDTENGDFTLNGLSYTSYLGWPSNYDSTYRGAVTVKIALSNSYNTPSAKILSKLGVGTSYNFLINMFGLTGLVEKDRDLAPLSVGALTYGVSVQEMTAAYTVFANGGIYSVPRCVTRVETYDGQVVLENDVDRTIVFTPQTSYIITDILMRAVTVGTSAVANLENEDEGLYIETAGKSGTTSSFNDRWFIGYTPYYLAGIWWGFDENTSGTTENTEHIRMWHEVMATVHRMKGITEGEFTEPDGLVTCQYCAISGKLVGPYCKSDPGSSNIVRTGIFKSGTQPTETCDVHHQLYVCSETGQIACQNCTDVKLVTYRDIERSYPYTYIEVSDSEYICPPLSPTTVLYNSQFLPVYTYMLPEGQYPTITSTKKKKYKNCICSAHASVGINHYYTYKFLTSQVDDDVDILDLEELKLPEPTELYTELEQKQNIEISAQLYQKTEGKYRLEGVSMHDMYPDKYDEAGYEIDESGKRIYKYNEYGYPLDPDGDAMVGVDEFGNYAYVYDSKGRLIIGYDKRGNAITQQ